MGGGGGGGGVIYNPNFPVTPGQTYTVTVGGGGAGRTSNGDNGGLGGDSVFSTLTAIGGGAGGNNSSPYDGTATGGRPLAGGSGGGSGEMSPAAPGTPGQGFMGGIALEAPNYPSGGGGGAGGPGQSPNSNQDNGGSGGPGLPFSITGELQFFGGGGGGGCYINGGTPGKGAIGGGGDGGYMASGALNGINAVANTGGGGGGGSYNGSNGNGGNGGSGAVYLRFNSLVSGSLVGTMRYNTSAETTEVWNSGSWTLQSKGLNQGSFDLSPDPRSIQGLAFWIDPAERVRGDTSRLRDLTGYNRLVYAVNHAGDSATNSGRYFRNTFGGIHAAHQSFGGHIVVAPTTGYATNLLNFAGGEDFSVVMWTYRTVPDSCGSWMTVQSGVGGEGYRIWREDCGCGTDVWNMYYDNTNNCTAQNGTNNRYRTWQMQIWQRERDQSRIHAYYGSNDYASTAEFSHTGAFSLLNGNSSSLSGSKAQWLHFGNSNWSAASESIAGFLGPIMIYRKALTAKERLLVFNMYKTRFGLR
jgi:hypothetical protein